MTQDSLDLCYVYWEILYFHKILSPLLEGKGLLGAKPNQMCLLLLPFPDVQMDWLSLS